MIIPRERNGPKGISDLIVKLFLSRGKFMWGISFFKERARSAKVAPIQKDKMTADKPWVNPRKKPKTKIYFTSPKPNQVPFEIRNIRRNGKARTRPEIKECIIEFVLSIMYKKEKIKKYIRKESGIIKCFKS